MGKKKSKKIYCFFYQLCYKHKALNKHLLCLKKSLEEVEKILGQCPGKKKKKNKFFIKNS